MIKSNRMHRRPSALIGVALCALLPACNHRSGFNIPIPSQVASAGDPNSATPAGNNPGSSNPGGDKPGNNPGGKDPADPTPKSAVSLLDPVTGLVGKTVVATGEAAKDLTGVTPNLGPVDHLLSQVGDGVIGLGANVRDNGVTGLPVVGGTLQNVSNTLDATATISVLDQAIGGTSPALGVGVLSPSVIGGSIGTIGLLSDGTLATVSLTPAAVGGLTPAVLGGATSGVLGSASPILNPATSLVGVTALNQQVGGGLPVIGVSALSSAPAQGSLATVNVLAGGSVASVGLAGNPLSVVSGPIAPAAGAVGGVVGAVTPNVVNLGGAAGGGVSVGGLQLGGAAGGGASLPIVGGLLGH